MQKQYKNYKHAWIIIPVFTILPCIRFLLDLSADSSFFLQSGLFLIVSFILYRYHRKNVAEIRDGMLHLYAGISLNDPDKIEIRNIIRIERISRTLLKIHGKEDVLLTFEARKPVLDRLEEDLSELTDK